MNNYITIVIAFIIGQFAYTTVTVYNLQNGKDINYWQAYNTTERGWAVGLGGSYLTGGVCGYITQDDLKVMNIKIPFNN